MRIKLQFLCSVLMLGWASTAVAQRSVAHANGNSPETSASVMLPLSPAEAMAHVNYERQQVENTISILRPDYPYDSIRAVVKAHAQRQLQRLSGTRRSGVQLNAYGELYAAAEHDDSAQAMFAARLGMKAVTITEQAYTYSLAVRVFSDYQRPARLPIAERYLAGLRALGPAATARQLEAEVWMMETYYNLNRYEETVRHARAAVDLLPRVPYKYRSSMYGVWSYGIIVDAVSHVQNGSAILEQINTQLRASLPAPADSAALDGEFAAKAAEATRDVDAAIAAHAKVGEVGKPIASNFWINTPDTNAHSIPVNDGKIRLLEFGFRNCPPCVLMYSALERIYEAFPGKVEPIIVTGTSGAWGNRVVTTELESEYLKTWFQEERKVRYPIALYRAPKVATDYGELQVNNDEMPNYKNYEYVAKPTKYLLDGHGVIRRVFVGYSREMEIRMVAAVRHLLADSSGMPLPSAHQ